MVSFELFRSYCLPVLLYASESALPCNADVRSLDNCINLVTFKIFGLSGKDNILHVRECFGLINLNKVIIKRRINFMDSLFYNPLFMTLIKVVYSDFADV